MKGTTCGTQHQPVASHLMLHAVAAKGHLEEVNVAAHMCLSRGNLRVLVRSKAHGE